MIVFLNLLQCVQSETAPPRGREKPEPPKTLLRYLNGRMIEYRWSSITDSSFLSVRFSKLKCNRQQLVRGHLMGEWSKQRKAAKKAKMAAPSSPPRVPLT
jgi:hypothetical protein